MKNFLSIGAVSQSIDLGHAGLTLVLGENLDIEGSGNKNGVGKSAMLSALCYALYGQALTNIKKDNLINSINKKNMVVSIEFERDGVLYRIERGRRPNFFKYIVNNENRTEDNSDEAQGENKDTQAEIERLLGLSHVMFKHIVSLNTYTEPFLSLGAGKQREIIEELLGITLLSQKSDNLKELVKLTKQKIEQEEFRIATIKSSNDRIQSAVKDLQAKIDRWNNNQTASIQELVASIQQLQHLDIDSEIATHKSNAAYREIESVLKNLRTQLRTRNQQILQLQRSLASDQTQLQQLQDHNCAMCGQTIHSDQQAQLVQQVTAQIDAVQQQLDSLVPEASSLQEEVDLVEPQFLSLAMGVTVYDSIEQAYNHKSSLQQLERELERIRNEPNPYCDQMGSLQQTMQTISYDDINDLSSLKDHQEFLLKLLTSKDSFIRKRIIDQNLAYLNHRLKEYLACLHLPHSVKFGNDLGVEINHMGQDYDFDSLSRGERTRVILGLSWAFRDIFEHMTTSINFMAVDEILDQGLDQNGVEKALETLKNMSRDRKKTILLVSHREELIPRCSQLLGVIKENGFTRFEPDYQVV